VFFGCLFLLFNVLFLQFTLCHGFAEAGFHPFSPQAPLDSCFVISPLVPPPPSAAKKGTKHRSISGQVLTPENTLRGLPPLPPSKKRASQLKAAPQRRLALLPSNTTQVVPINYCVTL
jgi:hypothetical protein